MVYFKVVIERITEILRKAMRDVQGGCVGDTICVDHIFTVRILTSKCWKR